MEIENDTASKPELDSGAYAGQSITIPITGKDVSFEVPIWNDKKVDYKRH